MSDLTITPNTTTTIGNNGSTSPATPNPSSKPAPNAPSPTSQSDVADSVTLSLASQSSVTEEKPALSEDDAQDQAAKLRQQLSSMSLSGTARQNQAIVSLLRS